MPSQHPTTERRCFVHESSDTVLKHLYNTTVCQDLPVEHEYEDNWYCVLHLPDDLKHQTTDFIHVLNSRLERQDSNFDYVYFSGPVHLGTYNFTSTVDFTNATFTSLANFDNATFFEKVKFNKTTFNSFVSFEKTTFLSDAKFEQTDFKKGSSFDKSTFKGDIYFLSSNFNRQCSFYKAKFFGSVKFLRTEFNDFVVFSNAVFEEQSLIIFWETKFLSHTLFGGSIIKGDLNFIGSPRNKLFEGDHNAPQFLWSKIANTGKVTFEEVLLYPRWFVDVDISKFNFTRIEWKNIDDIDRFIKEELESLKKREITHQPIEMLKTTYKQFALNAVENERHSEALMFRRLAANADLSGAEKKLTFLQSVADLYGAGKKPTFLQLVLHWDFKTPQKSFSLRNGFYTFVGALFIISFVRLIIAGLITQLCFSLHINGRVSDDITVAVNLVCSIYFILELADLYNKIRIAYSAKIMERSF
ncbi:MAG TPA: pentapeptide repeat-containing protein [Pyrinomonadaceae bacterium]|jgi:hypothetical protein